MRIIALAFGCQLIASVAIACSCVTTGTYCNAVSDVVFVGRVITDSGEGIGSGRAKVVVEEVLRGLPDDVQEVSVDSMPRTSCYVRLQKGERYVIYGSTDSGDLKVIHTGGCSFTFRVRGHENLLNAVRSAARGGPSMLVGKLNVVQEKYSSGDPAPAGLTIYATKGDETLETKTLSGGEFVFEKLQPGKYRLSVPGSDFVEDEFRFPREDQVVPARGCAYQSLNVWPNGMIEGTIRGPDESPLKDIPVQAFAITTRGEVDTKPFRVAKTDAAGRYVLNGLPQRAVIVGVNGEKYNDRLAWKPMFFPGTPDRDRASRLEPSRGSPLSGIDFKLAQPRHSATLHIVAVLEDGTPATGFGANVEDLSGTQRFFVLSSESRKSNTLDVQVYMGETYRVRAFWHIVKKSAPAALGETFRMTSFRGLSGAIQINQHEAVVRVVLREDQHLSTR